MDSGSTEESTEIGVEVSVLVSFWKKLLGSGDAEDVWGTQICPMILDTQYYCQEDFAGDM